MDRRRLFGCLVGKAAVPEPEEMANSRWPDLPPDIAGDILSRLTSPDDRLSFTATCRDWRLLAPHQQLPPPPAMPWIHLGRQSTYQRLDDGGKARRFGTPPKVRASFGGWLLCETKHRRCFLRDPFSPATPGIEVPCRYSRRGDDILGAGDPGYPLPGGSWSGFNPLFKMVVCSPDLVVAIFVKARFNTLLAVNFAYFRPPQTTVGAPRQPPLPRWSHGARSDPSHYQGWRGDAFYEDIAFHRGKVFGVTPYSNLFAHDFAAAAAREAAAPSCTEHVIKQRPDGYGPSMQTATKFHLVTSSDKQKLLMVRWSIPPRSTCRPRYDGLRRTMWLQVFEADLDEGRWSPEVTDLGGQDLYVGVTGSMARASSSSERGRVFVLGEDWASIWRHNIADCNRCHKAMRRIVIPDYVVYDMMSGETRLVSLNVSNHSTKSSTTKSSRAGWFFPP